ncbi:MAG TPA: putative glycoside hydrolase [Gemmatimonadaceae bacterium]
MITERRFRAVDSLRAQGKIRKLTCISIFACTLVVLSGCGDRAKPAVTSAASSSTRSIPTTAVSSAKSASPRDTSLPTVAYVARPDTLRGLYVNRWAAIGSRMWELIALARRTEVNALVIDVKDDRGLVLYRSRVPLVGRIGADTNRPMSSQHLTAVLDSMRTSNIYPIARIVVAKDPLLAGQRLEWAIKRRKDGKPWLDRNGHPWLDPTQPAVWQYAIALAREAHAVGFSAVQFDYVRFPDDQRLISEAAFPLKHGRTRAQVIRDQLGVVRDSLRVTGMPMTIDVFGLTATDTTDMGIGQRWEMFIDRADEVLPMVYPSHFAPGTYGLGNPNAHPYATIDRALKDVKRRTSGISGAARVVPWYQDFTLGPPVYGSAQVRAQIKAGYDNGFYSWILWNPGSRYTTDALESQ